MRELQIHEIFFLAVLVLLQVGGWVWMYNLTKDATEVPFLTQLRNMTLWGVTMTAVITVLMLIFWYVH